MVIRCWAIMGHELRHWPDGMVRGQAPEVPKQGGEEIHSYFNSDRNGAAS
jgi:hypothetical protein